MKSNVESRELQGMDQQPITGGTQSSAFSGDWKLTSLDRLAIFLKGFGLPKSTIDPSQDHPCIHYGELFTTYGVRISKVVSRTNALNAAVLAQPNDVLMPTSDVTPTGLATASTIEDSGVAIGGDVLIIRPNSDLLSGTFLAHVIRFNRNQILSLVTGSTVYHIYASEMKKFVFLLPSVKEQQKISEVLSDIDLYLESLDEVIAKKRNIKQGVMQQILTGLSRLPDFTSAWHKTELSTLVHFQNGFSFSSGDYVRSGHFLIRISNVQNGSIVLADPVFVEVSGKPRFSQFILENNDILISLTGNVGRVGRLKSSHLPAALNQRVAKISSKDREKLSEDFLYHCLRSTSFLDFVINSGEGAAQQNTSVAAIGKYLISYPNILEQEAIAEILNDLDADIEALIAQRDKAALIKIGIMQDLLTGKVRL
jgi:type I restriction enzyme S subunit